jgi:biopolymer transport protein ExbD
VDKKGKVSGVNVLHGVCEELDNQVVNLIAQSPSWTPATKNGKPVAVQLIQPVDFMIRTTKQLTPHDESNNKAWFVLTIHHDGKIDNGGKVYTVTQLKDIITPHEAGQPLTTVQIVAADDVRLGAVWDVKDELRKLGSLKIQYASPTGQEGTTRNMPPFPSSPKGYPEEYYTGEKSKNVCIVRINSADRVIFGDKVCSEYEEMLRLGEGFLRERGKEARFCLVVDRGTSYGAYRHMQELLFKVYEDIRNEKALEQYGKPLSELSTEERNQINWQVPFSISVAETKKAAS